MNRLARIPFAHLPTPLEPLPSLGRALELDLFVKRDDATGLAMGGNKARKLEYLVADAGRLGADTLLTFGGVQSNHARMTAAAAARCGMGCHLLLGGAAPAEEDGNLLLDHLFGAETEFLGLTPRELTAARVRAAYAQAEQRLKAAGRKPYPIPAGGSTPLGVYSYARAFAETLEQAAQMGVKIETVVTAVGTGGTFCGLVLGNILAGRPARVVGISVAPPGMPEALDIASFDDLVIAGAGLAHADGLPVSRASRIDLGPEDLRVDYTCAGSAYGAPTPESIDAIHLVARTEGLLLDPVYTSKAMAGLIGRARRGEVGREGAVVFVHTGGTPALFPYRAALSGARVRGSKGGEASA